MYSCIHWDGLSVSASKSGFLTNVPTSSVGARIASDGARFLSPSDDERGVVLCPFLDDRSGFSSAALPAVLSGDGGTISRTSESPPFDDAVAENARAVRRSFVLGDDDAETPLDDASVYESLAYAGGATRGDGGCLDIVGRRDCSFVCAEMTCSLVRDACRLLARM